MPTSSIPQSRLTPDASLRLVCLPYAGGGSAPFFSWRNQFPSHIDIVPLGLPGHDGRLSEPPLTELTALARLLADDLSAIVDKPMVLLGYSMGAWLAFEMSRELRRRRLPMPELLVVAASPAPHEVPQRQLHTLPDDELISALEDRYDGIPADVKASPELMQMLMPALRADIQMVETYRCAEEPPLEIEILALGGTDDPAVTPTRLEWWRRHTSRACSVRMLPGGHFFLFRGSQRAGTGPEMLPSRDQSPALAIVVERIQQHLASQAADNTAAQG